MAISFTTEAVLNWRDYNTDGIPGSGNFSPIKSELRTWGTEVEDFLKGDTPLDGIDINAGTIDGTPIGATSAHTGKFTTLEATGIATINLGTLVSSGDLAISKGGTASSTASAIRWPRRFATPLSSVRTGRRGWPCSMSGTIRAAAGRPPSTGGVRAS